MVITQTPYRISFFGGGTDYPAWSSQNGGSVLSTTIDKYCYISCRYLPPFFSHKHRFVYSEIESVSEISEVQHPAIRGVLSWMQWSEGVEVHHDGDLPARSGLGSSSAFTVGLINSLMAIQGRLCSKHQLAMDAIHVEQKVIGEAVGSQDQIAVAFGGMNKIGFNRDGSFSVTPLVISSKRRLEFEDNLMLFYTGQSRIAQVIAKSTIDRIPQNNRLMTKIQDSVDVAIKILIDEDRDMLEIGALFDEMWQIKRSLADSVSNDVIDDAYRIALNNGALGGKVLGAGGGGFMLFFVPPSKREILKKALSHFLEVPFRFEFTGSSISFYSPSEIIR